MKKKLSVSVRNGLKRLGADLKNARLRRRLKMVTIADRAGISRETLAKVQKGDPGVSMGNYASVIFALGLGTGWMTLADIFNDKTGQVLDEERIPQRARDYKVQGALMSREIFVHIDLKGKTYFVGRLWRHVNKGRERASFEYSSEWRSSSVHFSLEPALEIGEGTFHTEKALFGSIGDSAPDRWGRLLMERREARKARSENRRARKLHESDYLLMVNDLARQGALRFSETIDGPFLASGADIPIPPIVYLERLLSASDRILARTEMDEDLKDLVDPGASIGGARPKASVSDNEGNLLIAKFPSRNDDWDVELWEFLSFRMAERAGLSVPEFRLEKILNRNLLLLKRFDRRGQKVRIPFLSAMSMLGASDGDHGSYLDLGEILREYGSSPSEDLVNLWRRMIFNIMISNVDDHLRNHGFLYQGTAGWRLSPVYDLEPTPEHKKPRILHTRIDLYDGTASLDLAYEVAEEFGLDPGKARKIAREVAVAVKDWDKEAIRFGAGKDEVERMRSAFDHGDLHQALKGKAKTAM